MRKIFHMKLNLLIHPTAKKIYKTMTMKDRKVLLYKAKKYLQRKILRKVPQRNIIVTIPEQITPTDREMRNP